MSKVVIVIGAIFLNIFTFGCEKKQKEVDAVNIVTKNDNIVENIENVVQVEKKPIIQIDEVTYYEDDFFAFSGTVLREMDKESINNKVVQEKLIKDFVEHKLLLEEAKRAGVENTLVNVDSVVDSINTDKGSQELKVYSGHYSSDEKALTSLIEERRLVEALLTNVINANIVVSDEEIRKRYNEKEAKETPVKKAHIFQIFTRKEETIKKAYAELEKGINFSEVATRYSEGPEQTQGGDLGFVAEDDYPEIFAEAFKLQPNRYSNIIKSDYGYHIFLVKNIKDSKKYTYDDVKSKIYFELYSIHQEEKTREFIDGLFVKSDIKYLNNVDFSKYGSK